MPETSLRPGAVTTAEPPSTSPQPIAPAAASPEARQQLFQMALGAMVTQLLHVAATLGIADLLAGGPRNYADLARATTTHAPSLLRVLRALASLGVFTEVEEGSFGLTPLAACLRTAITDSFRVIPIYLGEELYRTAGDLLYSVQTGSPAFDHLYGMPYFAYLGQNEGAAGVFNGAMTALGAAAETPAVTVAYDFTAARTIVDVGGGEGSLLASILAAAPQAWGVLFDQPAVVESARPKIQAAGVAERCQLVSGDFFTAVPSGGDLYVLKRIIHDWDDEHSVAILRNCRTAIPAGGKLLVVEAILPPGDEPSPAKLVDIVMMGLLRGHERPLAEYRSLFGAAGFTLTRVVPTASPMSIIEGTPS